MGRLRLQSLLDTGRTVVDAMYTRRCAACGRRGAWVCAQCLESPLRITPVACTRCWASVPAECLCTELPVQIDRISAAYPYAGWTRAAILKFKFEGERARSDHLAACMDGLLDTAAPPDLLVPVPLHSDRQRTRGYNQAELLARDLGRQTGVPVSTSLVRRVERGHQVGRNKEERWEAVRDAFACPDPELVRGKRIVIVDDVITTGATVANCAVALDAAGARVVRAVSVARG